jgi:hypothetical protein
MPARRALPTGNRPSTLLDPFASFYSYLNLTKRKQIVNYVLYLFI